MRQLQLLLAASLLTSSALGQGGVSRFCAPGAAGARIVATGSAAFDVNGGSGDLVLRADNLPQASWGLFVYGNRATSGVPVGDGTLCVSGSPHFFRLAPLSAAAGATSIEQALDYLDAPSPAAMITQGSTWNFQFWFRYGNQTDLTDALEIEFTAPQSATPLVVVADYPRSGHPLAQTFEGGVLVLNTVDELQEMWDLHTSPSSGGPPLPPVDMDETTLVVAFAGRRLTGGYDIQILDVALSITSVDVTTEELQPGAGCGTTFSETNPMQVIAMRKVDEAVLRNWTANVSVYTCP